MCQCIKKVTLISLLFVFFSFSTFCQTQLLNNSAVSTRYFADTIGFATHQVQMDSIMARISSTQNSLLETAGNAEQSLKVAISPHDDYTYVGFLYPAILKNIKAKHVILFGVAHKARLLGLEDQLVFDSFDTWACPYGNVQISPFRNLITDKLESNFYTVNDSMQKLEHSVEAVLPFLQYFNPEVKIVSILVPYMSFEHLDSIAMELARVIFDICSEKKWVWGEDFAIVISNDAVHYGDEDWGTNDLNYFGGDSAGYAMAMDYEKFLISNCLEGKLSKSKIEAFYRYLNNIQDYRKSRWAWCGRYSIPMGLLTSFYLQQEYNLELSGKKITYATSIDHPHLKVNDLNMGETAPASIHHWVGYLGMGFK